MGFKWLLWWPNGGKWIIEILGHKYGDSEDEMVHIIGF